MSTNKITFLQSLKIGAWWLAMSFFPSLFLMMFIGVIYTAISYVFSSLVISILFCFGFIILNFALFFDYFDEIFPAKFKSFKILNTKKISRSTIFLNYIWIVLITSIFYIGFYVLLYVFIYLILGNTAFIQFLALQKNPFLNFFEIIAYSIIGLALTARRIINRNPDCFDFVPIDSAKKVVEGK